MAEVSRCKNCGAVIRKAQKSEFCSDSCKEAAGGKS